MKIELECKIPLPARTPLAEKLRDLGAEEEEEVYERNWTFDTADRRLARGRMLLRMRRLGDAERALVTVKRPMETARFKCMEEIEVFVESAEAGEALLNALGYEREWYYEKKRHAWRFRECEIALDRLPEIGAWVEIEGPDEDTLRGVIEALGLDPDAHVPDNYRELFARRRADRGEAFGEMRFADPKENTLTLEESSGATPQE